MKTISATAARASLHRLLETLFLLSIPGMRKSIRKGMREPLKQCSSRVDL